MDSIAVNNAGLLLVTGGGELTSVTGRVGPFSSGIGSAEIDGASSLWRITSVGAALNVGNGLSSSATLDVTDGATVAVTGFVNIGTALGSFGTVTVAGENATLEVGGNLNLGSSSPFSGTGNLNVQPGGIVDVANSLNVNSGDTLTFTGGTIPTATLNVTSSGTFDWTGGTLHAVSILGNITNDGGTLEPGFSIATLDVSGDYTQSTSGTLLFELESDAYFDQVHLTGTATLDGTLQVNLIDLGGGVFEPESDDVFEILAAVELVDEFSNIANGMRLTTFGGEGSFVVTYDTELGTVTLSDFLVASTFIPGDYNNNGVIDAADYTVWRDALTAGDTSLLNDPTPGTVDESDFLYWRAHFGQTLGGGAGAGSLAAVPEPASLALLILGSCLLVLRSCGSLGLRQR